MYVQPAGRQTDRQTDRQTAQTARAGSPRLLSVCLSAVASASDILCAALPVRRHARSHRKPPDRAPHAWRERTPAGKRERECVCVCVRACFPASASAVPSTARRASAIWRAAIGLLICRPIWPFHPPSQSARQSPSSRPPTPPAPTHWPDKFAPPPHAQRIPPSPPHPSCLPCFLFLPPAACTGQRGSGCVGTISHIAHGRMEGRFSDGRAARCVAALRGDR